MAAEDGLKAQKLLAQGVWDVAYDTAPFYLLFSYFIFFKSTSLYATLWRRQV